MRAMDYIYPINFVGHNEWLDSGYEPKLAQGDVVTRDGEFLGMWRVVDYDHEDEYSSGRIEFILDGESTVKFAEKSRRCSGFHQTNRSAVAAFWSAFAFTVLTVAAPD